MTREQYKDQELPVILTSNEEFSLAQIEAHIPVSENPMVVYISSLSSESSRRSMTANLHRASRFLMSNPEARAEQIPWSHLRFKHVRALHSMMIDAELAPATIKVTIAGVRGVMQAAYDLEQITADDLLRINNIKFPRGRGTREARGRCLADDEIASLFQACKDGTPAGVRDQAVLSVLFGAGLRREEVTILTLANFDRNEHLLDYIGKGNKQRRAFVPQGTILAINAWLDVRLNEPGPLFCPIHRSGAIKLSQYGKEHGEVDNHMTPQAIYNILEKRYLMAGIKHCSPHDGRRTCTTKLIEQTGDISLVQKIMGHSSIETTVKYDRRAEAARKRAIGSFHVPFF